MKLEWMGEYRNVLEALIHYCNIYYTAYKPEKFDYNGITYSFSHIQVLEYLIENEERNENMNAIATRLGISRSNFTKIVQRLVEKGLVEKRSREDNKKEINLVVTTLGHDLYENYSKIIYEYHFAKMFKEFDNIPKEYLDSVAKGLNIALNNSVPGYEKITFKD